MQSKSLKALQDYGFRQWHFFGIRLHVLLVLVLMPKLRRAQVNLMNPLTLDKAEDVNMTGNLTSHLSGFVTSTLLKGYQLAEPFLNYYMHEVKFDLPDL